MVEGDGTLASSSPQQVEDVGQPPAGRGWRPSGPSEAFGPPRAMGGEDGSPACHHRGAGWIWWLRECTAAPGPATAGRPPQLLQGHLAALA